VGFQSDTRRCSAGPAQSRKVRMARRLRQETTMTLGWIAQRLHMDAWTDVSNLLRTSK
jgi:hypothetical protein